MKAIKLYCIINFVVLLCIPLNADDDASNDPTTATESSDGNQPTASESPDETSQRKAGSSSDRSNDNSVPYVKRNFKQQQRLLVEVVTRLNLDPSSNLKEPSTNLFKILRKCSEIYKKMVNNDLFLHKILNNAMIAFQLLFEGLDANKLTPETFSDIMDTLTKCDADGKTYQFVTASCPLEIEKIITEENGNSTIHKPIIPRSRKFLEYENDLIVEINWKIFDFCHSRCFDHFRPQFNSHHYMGHEMERFMEQTDIHERWFRDTHGLSYLKGIISASNLLLRMQNLDFSVAAAHLNSKYRVWLQKPGSLKYREYQNIINLHSLYFNA